jgi:hypothetical protein
LVVWILVVAVTMWMSQVHTWPRWKKRSTNLISVITSTGSRWVLWARVVCYSLVWIASSGRPQMKAGIKQYTLSVLNYLYLHLFKPSWLSYIQPFVFSFMWPHLLLLLELMNSCWKEAKYLLLFCFRNFVLPVLEITEMFLGNINKDLRMNCCLPPNNRRNYLIDITFESMFSDFVFSGDLPLLFWNALINCRSEICRISVRTCFEVTDCNFFFSLYIVGVTDEFQQYALKVCNVQQHGCFENNFQACV